MTKIFKTTVKTKYTFIQPGSAGFQRVKVLSWQTTEPPKASNFITNIDNVVNDYTVHL